MSIRIERRTTILNLRRYKRLADNEKPIGQITLPAGPGHPWTAPSNMQY
jgi:hypothetical protein